MRFYEDQDQRAVCEDNSALEVEAHGWDHSEGDTVTIDGETYVLAVVYGTIHTGDNRGNYILALAKRG